MRNVNGNRRALLQRVSFRAAAKDRSGIAAVEFAMIVPVLILLALATSDLGLAIYANMQVEDSAAAGVGYAFLHGYDATAISNAVTGATHLTGLAASPAPSEFCGCPNGSGVAAVSCGSTCSTGNTAGTYVAASATMVYHTLISYPIVPDQYTFVHRATVRIK